MHKITQYNPFLLLRNQVINIDSSNTEFLDFESEVSIMAQLSTNPLLVRVYGAIDPTSTGTQKRITCFNIRGERRFAFFDDTATPYFCQRRWIVMGMLLFALVMCYFVMLLLLQNVVTVLSVMR
jgi:hypothetical protein